MARLILATLFLLLGAYDAVAFVTQGGIPTRSAVGVCGATAKPDNFRKADFIDSISEKTGLSKAESEKSLEAVLEVLQEQVSAGKRVYLSGFGTFTLRERAARTGRNPRTGEPLNIAASKSPGFSASKSWKDQINGKK